MIGPTTKLSASRQAIVVGIGRVSACCKPRLISDADLKPMLQIDKQHIEFRFTGGQMLQDVLARSLSALAFTDFSSPSRWAS